MCAKYILEFFISILMSFVHFHMASGLGFHSIINTLHDNFITITIKKLPFCFFSFCR